MEELKRRKFLQLSALSALPAFLPAVHAFSAPALTSLTKEKYSPGEMADTDVVSFVSEGPNYNPVEYVKKLQEIMAGSEISRDFYGQGGVIEQLCKKMAKVTGKEAAVYIPTGTLANQLAISVLSGENSKVFVQETSHVYRDEADASQTLYNKRLIPLAKGGTFFTAEELEASVNYHRQEEVFKTGVGAVSIEVPVRRTDNCTVPYEEIKKISAYCKKNNFKLHLDGARLHLASAFTGVSVKEYADHFDTVYMCMYKYLGANGGAILCGANDLISKMDHLVKIHGGSIFSNWPNAAIALHNLEGIDERMKKMVSKWTELSALLNKVPGLKITAPAGNTNVFLLNVSAKIKVAEMKDSLRKKFFIYTAIADEKGTIRLHINETLLKRDNESIVKAFSESVSSASS